MFRPLQDQYQGGCIQWKINTATSVKDVQVRFNNTKSLITILKKIKYK